MGVFPHSDGKRISHAQALFKAKLLLSLHRDPADGATGIIAHVPRVIDTAGNETTTLLGSFRAQLTYGGNRLNILDVRELDFTLTDLSIDNLNGTTTFIGASIAGVAPTADLAHALTRIVGSNQQLCSLTVEVVDLTDSIGVRLDVLPPDIFPDRLTTDKIVDQRHASSFICWIPWPRKSRWRR